MNILLLQDEIYLPSLGGGTKANRFLLEALARRGHACLAITRLITRSPDGPNSRRQFLAEMDARKIQLKDPRSEVLEYRYRQVRVQGGDWTSTRHAQLHAARQIEEFAPDGILVADDKRRFLLSSAMRAAAERVVPLVQTIVQLPFGPLAVSPCSRQAELMRQARCIIVISEYLQRYLKKHGELDSRLLRMPVYGDGPFPSLARFDAGYITMVNPCALKGVAIFLALARRFPRWPFAAVPTWGAEEHVLKELRSLPNVRLLKPDDDIEAILRQTRVLLVPSLWPETFGYVVPEAMLRGIPVLASNVGGLPEAKLGVDYVLPVAPADQNMSISAEQDTVPWSRALEELLTDQHTYRRCSRASRAAAHAFVSPISAEPFEQLLSDLANHRKTPSNQTSSN